MLVLPGSYSHRGVGSGPSRLLPVSTGPPIPLEDSSFRPSVHPPLWYTLILTETTGKILLSDVPVVPPPSFNLLNVPGTSTGTGRINNMSTL